MTSYVFIFERGKTMEIIQMEKSLKFAYEHLLDEDLYFVTIKWHTNPKTGAMVPTLYTKHISNIFGNDIRSFCFLLYEGTHILRR